MKGDVIDPATGLPTDLEYHVTLLSDIVSDARMQKIMVERKVATGKGLDICLRMLNATQGKLGSGMGDPNWWSRYGAQVRGHLYGILKDMYVRKAAARHIARKSGGLYLEVLPYLATLYKDLGDRIALERASTEANILIVES